MKKIGIIVAMDKEYEQLSKVFEGRTDIVLQKCGIGKVNAAVGATEMLRDHQPDLSCRAAALEVRARRWS